MHTIKISNRGKDFYLRLLEKDDFKALGSFFLGLSSETRSRFAPHPLDEEYAIKLCRELKSDTANRFVLSADEVLIGYFILDPLIPGHESERYRNYNIELLSWKDCIFAPCLTDAYQDKGLGGKAMPYLMDICYRKGYRSLVLLGGTQESNARALQFYRKFGFKVCGGYQTTVFNMDMRLEL